MRRHELSSEQWEKVKGILPPEHKAGAGRPAKENRNMLNGIIYRLNTGVAWRDLPERFGPWKSVYTRFRRWTQQGVWEKLLATLIEQDIVDETTLMLDSTMIKVHQHGSGVKKGSIMRRLDEAGEV
jgi:transposase